MSTLELFHIRPAARGGVNLHSGRQEDVQCLFLLSVVCMATTETGLLTLAYFGPSWMLDS